ncbi:amino acid racemase [Erythrobacter sp. LQ02-29]|uniref:aspartate/glutamate racemase family protein n=1 Tax=Erythrobacter sp. LQ02-29 TaxID=2920384 RepID=UPI001F4D6859|nr:amino acid racemase [Erythrobacter sp. LQ02-29]MCP9222336.1 amino acid racemase [Erythrobacter sp. LQ02-29]
MRKLGMIGGMSWISTETYYRRINERVRREIEPMASAPLLIESLDYRQLWGLLDEGDWSRAGDILEESAKRLADAGAQGLILCANSMHRLYDRLTNAVSIPVLHIADAVGAKMKADGATKNAALIGTRNVMTESFYRQRLVAQGIDLLPPDMSFAEQSDRIIYEQLMQGRAPRDAERYYRTVITQLEQAGAKAIVLACTELAIVVDVDANVLPIYDSARIHCNAAVDWMMDG